MESTTFYLFQKSFDSEAFLLCIPDNFLSSLKVVFKLQFFAKDRNLIIVNFEVNFNFLFSEKVIFSKIKVLFQCFTPKTAYCQNVKITRLEIVTSIISESNRFSLYFLFFINPYNTTTYDAP